MEVADPNKKSDELNKPVEIDISALDAVDEADMVVMHNDRPTTWVWTFAGPGHPRGVAQNERVSREALSTAAAKEQARTNGKKWKEAADAPDEVREKNASFVLERLLRWSPVKLNGETLSFSPEAARKLLLDPRKDLLAQSIEFLTENKSFTKRAATS